jgi:hypothetical protein
VPVATQRGGQELTDLVVVIDDEDAPGQGFGGHAHEECTGGATREGL